MSNHKTRYELLETPNQPSQSGEGFEPGSILRNLTISATVATTLVTVVLLWALYDRFNWQIAWVAGAFGIAAMFAVNANFNSRLLVTGISSSAMMISAIFVALFLTAMFIEGLALPAAAVTLVLAILVSSIYEENRGASNAILIFGMSIAAATAIIGEFPPFRQVVYSTASQIGLYFAIAMIALVIILVITRTIATSLKGRLLLAFLALVILPLGVLTYISINISINNRRSDLQSSLELAGQRTAREITYLYTDTKRSMDVLAKLPDTLNYLQMTPAERDGSAEETELLRTMQALINPQIPFTMGILDTQGINLIDTATRMIGQSEANTVYFKKISSSSSTTVVPLIMSTSSQMESVIVVPIKNAQGAMVGVVRGRINGLAFQTIAAQFKGLLRNTQVMVLSDYNIRIADTQSTANLGKSLTPLSQDEINELTSEGILLNNVQVASSDLPKLAEAVQNIEQTPYFSIDFNPSTFVSVPENGAIVKVEDLPWTVVYYQADTSDVLEQLQLNRFSVLITTILAFFAGLLALLASGVLVAPIQNLTQAAQRIAAGDLDIRLTATFQDEYTVLANAFNKMAQQLRTLVADLEGRVQERTSELQEQNQALQYRQQQLQTIAQVARSITSEQNLETLLTNTTRLISDRFDFYHVGIFLLDENKEYAVLAAANSEGGQRMLARAHQLRVGQVGIVGYATGNGQARIATDVGQDAVYFNNPDLPMTRSEMALPLLKGSEVIGALDVQSTVSNAFSVVDIELFTTLADQIAVAITNSRLLDQTQLALEESRQTHRMYLNREWTSLSEQKPYIGIQHARGKTGMFEKPLAELQDILEVGEVKFIGKNQVAVPLLLRGEAIGALKIQAPADVDTWDAEQIDAIRSITEQIALTLESARLYETAQRRADREKLVLEITNRIRSTNDAQEMLRIAAQELKNALRADTVEFMSIHTAPYPGSNGATGSQGTI